MMYFTNVKLLFHFVKFNFILSNIFFNKYNKQNIIKCIINNVLVEVYSQNKNKIERKIDLR